MLTLVPPARFDTFYEALRHAAETTFPGHGYSPDAIAKFLSLNDQPFRDTHYLFAENGAAVAVAMLCGDLLEYVVPTAWERRYEGVARTIEGLKERHPALHTTIRDDVPSHASWYAALLPGLGFEMTPRYRMEASAKDLLARHLQEIPPSYALSSFDLKWLEPCIDLHVVACGLSGDRASEMADNLRASIDAPDRRDSWITAVFNGEPVGSCFGSHHRDRLFVEELAVAESHRRKGLARRLLLESVRRLAEAFNDAQTVVLDVDRMSTPAVALYRSLGFEAKAHYTVARRAPGGL